MVARIPLVAGRYRVGRRVGAGGLSHVWLATDESTGDTVAVKRCALPEGLSGAEPGIVQDLLLREARAFARVEHPNVVAIRDIVPDGDEPWLVMDYIPSRSLREVVTASGAMHPRRAAEIGLHLLRGLEGVFQAGVLHLDVKPGNVLVADDGRVLLSDFGPAVTHAGVRTLTDAGIVLGSLQYVAPERLFDGVSTQRADLWSLGATLYFAVEGRPPFRRDTEEETVAALRTRTPDPLLRAGPLTEVIAGLMRADPDDRLSVAAAERLLRRVAGSGVAALAPAPIAGRPGRHVFRRPAPVAATVAAAVVAALAIGAAVRQSDQAQARPAASPAPAPVVSASTRPPFVLPSGYSWRESAAGRFRIALPAGWTVSGSFTATGRGGGPVLTVSSWPAADPLAGLIELESTNRLDNYQRVQLGQGGWEYTYKQDGAAFRAQQQVVRAGGRTYRIAWVCPRDRWSADLATWSTVLRSFGPLGGA